MQLVADLFPITDPAGVVAVLLTVLALLFWFGQHAVGQKFFGIVPMLVFCYFVPTALTTIGVIPDGDGTPVYGWVKTHVLPGALILLIIALDIPGIVRLGPRAVIMLLAGTLGVVIGGPMALLVFKGVLPEDAWRGMSALCGSWIGGGANFVALGETAGASDDLMGQMVIVDVFVANIWMGVLLWSSGHEKRIDRLTGADASAIEELKVRVAAFEERTARRPTLADLMIMVALAFMGSWLCFVVGNEVAGLFDLSAFEPDALGRRVLEPLASGTLWKFVLATAIGLALSFSRVRNLEGAGASRVGSVMLYLLVACIGASADFRKMLTPEAAWLIAMGALWMVVHIGVLLTVARLVRAPIFLVAVGSQANIGGAASAPVVASAFHPSLAPVGVLLAVAGYVLGTYAGLLCMFLMRLVAGA